jgi:hypothetical protein
VEDVLEAYINPKLLINERMDLCHWYVVFHKELYLSLDILIVYVLVVPYLQLMSVMHYRLIGSYVQSFLLPVSESHYHRTSHAPIIEELQALINPAECPVITFAAY